MSNLGPEWKSGDLVIIRQEPNLCPGRAKGATAFARRQEREEKINRCLRYEAMISVRLYAVLRPRNVVVRVAVTDIIVAIVAAVATITTVILSEVAAMVPVKVVEFGARKGWW